MLAKSRAEGADRGWSAWGTAVGRGGLLVLGRQGGQIPRVPPGVTPAPTVAVQRCRSEARRPAHVLVLGSTDQR